jgi:hypothetical protein
METAIGSSSAIGPASLTPWAKNSTPRSLALDWISRDRFDIQWHRHTGTWFCLHRGLSLVEALKTIESDGLLHPL